MRVSYLGVGQGDATLIETPGGSRFLIDVGFDGRVLDSLSKELSFFEKSIDGVFLTHSDLDHVGGIIDIVEYFNIGTIYISSIAEEVEIYDVMYSKLEDYDEIVVRKIDGKNTIVIDEEFNVVIDVIFPIENYPFDNRNDKSLVMNMTYEDTSFMFTGDAGVEIEEYIISSGYNLDSDVLQVGHHGSNTSSSYNFIKATSPDYAVISSGKDNDYGHPHQEVVDRLDGEDIEILRTDELGNISFISDGRSIILGK